MSDGIRIEPLPLPGDGLDFVKSTDELRDRIMQGMAIPGHLMGGPMSGKARLEATRQAFIDDIIAHPDDDTPRLIFADWLKDQGEWSESRVRLFVLRWPSCDQLRLLAADWFEQDGQSDRSEFIRLQCRYAKIHPHLSGHRDEGCPTCAIGYSISDTLTTRFRVPSNGPMMSFRDCPYHAVHPTRKRFEWDWYRGFVRDVRCSLDGWHRFGCLIAQTHPVESVGLSDKRPAIDPASGAFYWHGGSTARADESPHAIGWLWDYLPNTRRSKFLGRRAGVLNDGYSTEAEAQIDLSRACIRWASEVYLAHQ